MIGKHGSCELNWVFDYSRDVLGDNTENIAIGIGSVLVGYPVILGTLLRMWEFSGTTLQSELLQFQLGILLNYRAASFLDVETPVLQGSTQHAARSS